MGRWLYAHAAALNDITKGKNNGCRQGLLFSDGYPAAKGWDAVTGLVCLPRREPCGAGAARCRR